MRPVTWTRLSADVLSLYAPSMRAPATFRVMNQTLKELAAVPGVKRSSDLTPQAIARWIDQHPDRSPARTEGLLRCIRVIANYAVSQGILRSSPFAFRPLKAWMRADLGKPKASQPRTRYRTAEEIGRLLRLLDDEAGLSWSASRLQALVYTYAYTALRKEEALHVLARNIDLAAGTLKVEPVGDWRPKTVRSARVLPLATPLARVLEAWLPRCGSEWLFPGRRLATPWRGSPGGYKPIDQIRAAAERAGISGDVTIIGFRKSFGTHAKAMGLGPLEVAAILGHTSVDTQAHYDEERVESLRSAMAKIEAFYLTGS